jgi:hypothetical protein
MTNFDAFFDEAWWREANLLVERYATRGQLAGSELERWQLTREYKRAAALYSASQHDRDRRQALRTAYPRATARLQTLPGEWQKKWHLIRRAAKKNARYCDDLNRLFDLGMDLPELVERVYSGGMFSVPDGRGRPPGPHNSRGFKYEDQLCYTSDLVRQLIDGLSADKKSAVASLAREIYGSDENRNPQKPGPATSTAFRKAINPLFDAVLWRLEARRYRQEEKKRRFFPPSTSAAGAQ